MTMLKPVAPQPIKELPHKTNIWLIIIPIVFIAVAFILYVYAWQESIAAKKINYILQNSRQAINTIAFDGQEKIDDLQLEIDRLKRQMQEDYSLNPPDDPKGLADKIDKKITLSGNISNVMLQHPTITLDTETHYEYHYIDTKYGQIQALRGNKIKCDDQLRITGTLHGIEGLDAEGKTTYLGYYMFVDDYECLE